MEVTSLHSDLFAEMPAEEIQESLPASEALCTDCTHCGLPVGPYPVGSGPFFCCTGCELVYDALQHAGYGDTYYRLSTLSSGNARRQPVADRRSGLHLLELDTNEFIEHHTKQVSGTRRQVTLFLDGVHCAACVWLVERLPAEIAGVYSARLDLSRGHLVLEFEAEQVQLSDVARWLARFGYQAFPVHRKKRNDKTQAERRLLIKMGVCWALAGNVMLFAFAIYAGLDLEAAGDASNFALATGARWASFVLASVAVLYGGSEFFRNAWSSVKVAIRHRHFGGLHMDTPISIGILVGFGYGAWATVVGEGDIWFDSITTLIAALLTARWLQLRSYRLAGDATDRLLNFIPTMARLVKRNQQAARSIKPNLVKVEMLEAGDVISVPAGEVFPVDGEVTEGFSMVDKSVLTGESRPEKLAPGMRIEAGTTNLQAPVLVAVISSGEATRVGRLLAWVGEHTEKRAPVVMLVDRLSGYFVAVLLLLATVTALIWATIDSSQVVARVVALLVISCPCALGMATPLAMSIASGRAARKGIFIKSSQAVQLLESVNAVVIDKTGTLTEGRMAVVETAGSFEAVELASHLEQHSNHPIARAVVDFVRSKRPNVSCDLSNQIHDLTLVQGCGVSATVNGKRVQIGRPDWISQECTTNPALKEKLAAFATDGYSPVAVGIDGRLEAALAVGDKIRQDASALIHTLKGSGRNIYLLSGDHPEVVQKMGAALHIPQDHVFGGVSPEEKKTFVEQLQIDNSVVAMVGDGVNDAAALRAADVGVAVAGGSTPSQVAADVFLTREGLQPVVEIFAGAESVMRVIKRNLGFSLVYNVIGAGAAVLGFVTPLVAAVAMPVSSLVVVLASVMQHSFSSSTTNPQ